MCPPRLLGFAHAQCSNDLLKYSKPTQASPGLFYDFCYPYLSVIYDSIATMYASCPNHVLILLCISLLFLPLFVERLDRTIGGKRHTVDLELSLSPVENTLMDDTAASTGAAALEVGMEIENSSIKSSSFTREELLAAIKSGVEMACVQGNSLNLSYIFATCTFGQTFHVFQCRSLEGLEIYYNILVCIFY